MRCEAVVNGPELCTCRTVPGASVGRSHAGELYEGSARSLDVAAREGELEWEEVIAPFVEPGATAVAHDIVLTREWQNPRS